jgi:hypothetical protein
VKKVMPFVITADHQRSILDRDDLVKLVCAPTKQLSLFPAENSAVTGQL